MTTRPPSGDPAPTTAILAGADAPIELVPLAEAICRRYRDEFPDEQARYGDAGMAWCVHDNQHILNWAVGARNGYVDLQKELAWLARAGGAGLPARPPRAQPRYRGGRRRRPADRRRPHRRRRLHPLARLVPIGSAAVRMRVLIAVIAASLGVASASLVAGCGEKRTSGTGTGHAPTTPTTSTGS